MATKVKKRYNLEGYELAKNKPLSQQPMAVMSQIFLRACKKFVATGRFREVILVQVKISEIILY